MALYGLPYQGSKSKICDQICSFFPKATHFYDLFGGGFSVAHYMLKHRSKCFQQFHFNELRPGVCELIKDAIAGKYNYNIFKPAWISREEFFAKKDTDAYIKLCWSFGNNGEDYLFGKNIEQYKKSVHMAVVFSDFDDLAKKILELTDWPDVFFITDRRLFLRRKIEHYRITKIPDILLQFLSQQQLDQLRQLEQLQRLERLQQLERLERLQQLEFYNLSYQDVPIKKNSVIYCDPPYATKEKRHYGVIFNTKNFLDWAASIDHPVFISEYNIQDSRFKEIASIKKRSLLSATKSACIDKQEKLYANNFVFKARQPVSQLRLL